MANVSLKTDFKNGEKLFDHQLNNNFAAIQAALAAMNKIVWQDEQEVPDSILAFRGTTEELMNREIIDGQLLYDINTGESYIDYEGERISTGGGNAIYIGEDTPNNPSTQLWINPSESVDIETNIKYRDKETGEFKDTYSKSGDTLPIGSVVEYDGDEVPSGWEKVDEEIIYNNNVYTTEEQVIGWWTKKDGTKVLHYRKTIYIDALPNTTTVLYPTGITNLDFITHMYGTAYTNTSHLYQMSLPNASSTLTSNVSLGRDNDNITITSGSDRSSWCGQVTLEYIKTTDAQEVSE